MQIIQKINIIDQIEGKLDLFSKNISFSVLSPRNNKLNIEEIKQLYQKNKSREIDDYIQLTPIRILEMKIIVYLTLKVQLKNLHQDLEKKYLMLKEAICQEYNFFDSNLVTSQIEDIVTRKIAKLIESKVFNPIEELKLKDRETLCINGPIASGKSFFENIFSKKYEKYLKINGDSYKAILNPEYRHETSQEKAKYFSQLTQYEVNKISYEIITKLLLSAKTKHKAPNVYVDKSFASKELVEFATYGGGTFEGYLIYTNPEESIIRNNNRGALTNRYEDTHNILQAHSSIAIKMLDLLTSSKEKNITYNIFYNNFNSSEIIEPSFANNKTCSASLIASFSLKNKTVFVENSQELCRFLNKPQLQVESSISQSEIVYSNLDFCEISYQALQFHDYSFF